MHACGGRRGEGGTRREQQGESSAGLECDADRTARIEQRVGRGGAGERVARRECGGAPWRSLPSTRRVVVAEAVSGKSGGVGELHCQRAAAADKSHCGLGVIQGRRSAACHLASSDTVRSTEVELTIGLVATIC